MNIKLSENPAEWVSDYLRERCETELSENYYVHPAMNPQFDFYIVPKELAPQELTECHVRIVPLIASDLIDESHASQVADVVLKIDKFEGEHFLIWTYDCRDGRTDIIPSDETYIVDLLLNNTIERFEEGEASAD